MDVSFRVLGDDDLPMLHRWLNEPGVVTWWEGDDVSWEGVVAHYGSPFFDSLEHWICSIDSVDTGWIQCYAIGESSDEARQWSELGVPSDHTAGIDYLVGEPGDRGRGLGAAMIRGFTEQVVFGKHPAWERAGASPLAANEASWKALRNAGFVLAGVIDDADGPCNLMVIGREGQQPPPK